MESDTKKKIAQIALELFSQYGYSETSMRMIADQAGISKPAVYYHFPNKESLFYAIFEYGLQYINDSMEKIAQSDLSAPEKIREIIRMRIAEIGKHKSFSRFINRNLESHIRQMRTTKFQNWISKHSTILFNIVQQGVDNGEFREDLDVSSFVYCLFGGINQLCRDWMQVQEEMPSHEQEERLFDMLMRGALRNQSN